MKSPFEVMAPEESVKNFIINSFAIVPMEDWDERVLPVTKRYNEALEIPIEEDVLENLYNLIVKVEMEKRSKPGAYLPSLHFSDLVKRKFPDIRYVIEPFFEQGTVNMITAPPNNWKSWMVFLFAKHVAEGSSVMEKFQTAKSKIMIVNEEDSLRLIQDRFKILGITDVTLPIYFRVAQGAKLEEKFVDKIIAECKEKEIGVVMFDSLRAIHDGEENDSTEMQKVLDLLKKIARENITVVFTHHHKKKPMMGKGDASEMFRGSTAILAAVSGYISLEEEERELGNVIVVNHLKSKSGEKIPPFEIGIKKERDEIGKVVKMEFVYGGEFKKAEHKIMQAKDGIMSVVKVGEWKTVKDFVALGFASKNIVRQALSVLKTEGLIACKTRKQIGGTVATQGKLNENLYSSNEEKEVEINNDPLEELFND